MGCQQNKDDILTLIPPYLTLYQKCQNFQLVQIESICRRQNNCDSSIEYFFLAWRENIMGKGENAGYQHFLLFPQCFQKASYSRSGFWWVYQQVSRGG